MTVFPNLQTLRTRQISGSQIFSDTIGSFKKADLIIFLLFQDTEEASITQKVPD